MKELKPQSVEAVSRKLGVKNPGMVHGLDQVYWQLYCKVYWGLIWIGGRLSSGMEYEESTSSWGEVAGLVEVKGTPQGLVDGA